MRDTPRCQGFYGRGAKQDERCPYAAVNIVYPAYGDPMLFCGYHSRSWLPEVIYPLDWPLSRQRHFRMTLDDRP